MNVKIYEERTGQMIFPVIPGKEPEKDENTIDLFNNHIDLYVEKKAKTIRITCHILIQQSPEESKGYYITTLSKYEDDIFTEFKKESNKALRILNIQRNPDDINNTMFNNIEKLDLDLYLHEDTDIVALVLQSGEYLEYQAGNIDEISIFCKDIIRKIENSKIAISSDVSKLGDINILRTKKNEEPLRPNERTRIILDKYRKELVEKKRKEEESIGRTKINEGTVLIKEGLTILRSTGYEPNDIAQEIDKVFEEVSASNKIKLNLTRGKEKGRSVDKGKPVDKSGTDKSRSVNGNTGGGIISIIRANKSLITSIVAILLIIGVLYVYITYGPGAPSGSMPGNTPVKGGTGKDTPVPIATLPPIKNAVNNNIDTVINNSTNN